MSINSAIGTYVSNLLYALRPIVKHNNMVPLTSERINHDQFCYLLELLDRADITEICAAARQIMYGSNSFWANVSSSDNITLMHSGKASLITNKLTDITNELFSNIEISDEILAEEYTEIEKVVKLREQIIDALHDVLLFGDGAFLTYCDKNKINFKFVSGRNIRYIYDVHKNIEEIVAVSQHENEYKNYLLEEHYGPGYVHYILLNEAGERVPLDYCPECADLQDIDLIETESGEHINLFLAVKFEIYKSKKYEGRGQSIFENKIDYLDALDEILSQRQTEIRKGASRLMLSSDCINKDKNGRTDVQRTLFNQYFEKLNVDPSNQNDIEMIQFALRNDEYEKAEKAMEDHIYEGLIDKSTMSHEQGVNNTAIALQHEKLTIYTTNAIKKAICDIVPELVYILLYINHIEGGKELEINKDEIRANIEEYGNPSFETQVDITCRLKQCNALSNYERLKIFYGETKTDEEIQEIAAECDRMDGLQNAIQNTQNEEE